LAEVKASVETLHGPVAQRTFDDANRGGDAENDGLQKELPKAWRGDTAPADFVGKPNAEGSSAARSSVAVAAKDSPSPKRFFGGAAIIEAKQTTVANERADPVAVWTRRLLEPSGEGVPIVVVSAKPLFVGHERTLKMKKCTSRKSAR
jgi:hypothetical protein